VGARTIRAVTGFRFDGSQKLALKGKSEGADCAILLERGVRERARLPFLGREHDLEQLMLVARRAFSERRPQLVTITAPAGTGKSRLVEEFVARLEPDVLCATAQCLPYGAAVTSLPLQGLVRSLLGLPAGEDVQQALLQVFQRIGHQESDSQRLATLIGASVGEVRGDARGDPEEIHTAWRVLIETLARTTPLVVVFEDLHWASDSLLDLVDYVTNSRSSAPLVMIALARSELLDRRPHWGSGRRNLTSVALESLDEEQTQRLVKMLAGDVPQAISRHIAERAGGNPFFVGELVRSYLGRLKAGAASEEIVLPDTVHATVLARLDALDAPTRAVLECAAIAGRSVQMEALLALLPEYSATQLHNLIEILVESDLMTAQAGGRYAFRHIVIREVAYATLTRAERARAHIALAAIYEQRAAADPVGAIEFVAYHYRQAIACTMGKRIPEGVDARRVIAAFEQVARVAARSGAHAEAGRQILEAIRLSPPEDHQRLFELLGEMIFFGDASVDAYRQAFEQWELSSGSDPRVGARLLVRRLLVSARWIGTITSPMPDEELARLVKRARSLLDQAPDPVLEAHLACVEAFRDDNLLAPPASPEKEEIRKAALAAADFFAASGDAEAENQALDSVGSIHGCRGEFEEALSIAQRRVARADAVGTVERLDSWSVMIWNLVMLGRFAEAIAAYKEVAARLRVAEPDVVLSHALSWAIYAAAMSGKWEQAQQWGDLLVDMRERSPHNVGRFTQIGWIGMLRVAAGRFDETRLARLRSAYALAVSLEQLSPDWRDRYAAFSDDDPESTRRVLLESAHPGMRGPELVARWLYDFGELLSESEIAILEGYPVSRSPVMQARLRVARGLLGAIDDFRQVVQQLDATELVDDAARAWTLLALRSGKDSDRLEARRRLEALGNREFLQRLEQEEEFGPKASRRS
jgi:hypothetical protein